MNTIIDLTDDTPEDESFIENENETQLPTEITPDIVDLRDSDNEVDTKHAFPLNRPATKIRQNSHPKKVRNASRKRKRGDGRSVVAECRAPETLKKTVSHTAPANIAGGCNFIIIDDDPSDGEDHDAEKKSIKLQASKNAKRSCCLEENARKRAFDLNKHYNYLYSQETALEMQERLLRESAAKLKEQQAARIAIVDQNGPCCIMYPIADIHIRFPDHWKWKEPYACLGLPENASSQLIKAHFRRLARIYHPDKSKLAETSKKFHGVVTAYRKLTQLT